MKTAYLAIVSDVRGLFFAADLFFSSPDVMVYHGYDEEKKSLKELLGDDLQLVEVKVHDDFDDWDYVPENY